MKILVENLKPSGWFDCLMINIAIQEKRFDNRSFQRNHDEIVSDYNDNIGEYHIRRIATLIHEGTWGKDPILVYINKETVCDGGHRIWAAKCLNVSEIEAVVIQGNELDEETRKNLWNKINELNENIEEALISLNIPYLT